MYPVWTESMICDTNQDTDLNVGAFQSSEADLGDAIESRSLSAADA
jgi:hypothetical protein